MAGEANSNWWPILALVVVLTGSWAVWQGFGDLSQAQEELRRVRETNQELHQQNQIYYRQAERLREDPEAIEWVCRQDMGMVRPDEVVYLEPKPLRQAPATPRDHAEE